MSHTFLCAPAPARLISLFHRQDFEALTPNLLARTIETVEGGGLVILLLSSLRSLTQLYSLTMDVHARLRTDAHQDITGAAAAAAAAPWLLRCRAACALCMPRRQRARVRAHSLSRDHPDDLRGITHTNASVPPRCRPRLRATRAFAARFNERMVLSLASCPHCLLMDDELNVLPTSSLVRHIAPLATAPDGRLLDDPSAAAAAELAELKGSLADTQPAGALVSGQQVERAKWLTESWPVARSWKKRKAGALMCCPNQHRAGLEQLCMLAALHHPGALARRHSPGAGHALRACRSLAAAAWTRRARS